VRRLSPREGRNEGRERGVMISTALDSTEWVRSRRRPFHTDEFAEGVELPLRKAQRWLRALELRGVVAHVGGPFWTRTNQ